VAELDPDRVVELDPDRVTEVDPDRMTPPETPPCDELAGEMVEFDPVGNMVLTSGTPDEV
jgi:hypothetical protein